MRDYPILGGSVSQMQVQTYQDHSTIWQNYPAAAWQWLPVLQGDTPSAYVAHAHMMQPLLASMYNAYGELVIGVGSLVRKDMNIAERAGYTNLVLEALGKALPGVRFFAFGLGVYVLNELEPHTKALLVGSDSSSWASSNNVQARQAHDNKRERARLGMTKWQYQFYIELPAYYAKVEWALEKPRTSWMFA